MWPCRQAAWRVALQLFKSLDEVRLTPIDNALQVDEVTVGSMMSVLAEAGRNAKQLADLS